MPRNPLDLVVTERVDIRHIIEFDSFMLQENTIDVTSLGLSDANYNLLQSIVTSNTADYYEPNASWVEGETRVTREANAFSSLLYNNRYICDNFVDENTILVIRRFNDFLTSKDLCILLISRKIQVGSVNNDLIVRDDYLAETDGVNIYMHRDSARFGFINRYDEGYFSEEEDYVYSEDSDCYFANDSVADDAGYSYCESCQDHIHSDNHNDCDEQEDSFDNTYTQTKDIRLNKTAYMDYTFGIEIETCNRTHGYDNDLNLKVVEDGSIDGVEFVTGVLHGNRGVDMIKKVCEQINNNDGLINKKCGVHIHIGGTIFNRRFSIMLAKLCYNIQDDVYKMLPESRKTNTFCKPLPEYTNEIDLRNYKEKLGKLLMGNDINDTYNKKKAHPGGHYNSQRYSWVNMTNYSCASGTNTVEFRPHGGTTDFNKIYNWLLICMCIVKFTENQQRRIWTSGMSKNKLTLHEVIKYGLKEPVYNKVWQYCQNRAKNFGNVL